MRIHCKNCNFWINFKNEMPDELYFSFKDLLNLKKNEYTYMCFCGMSATFHIYDENTKKVKKVEICYNIKEDILKLDSLYNDNLTIDKKKTNITI